jgi:uncharacterized protein DUF4340
MRGLRSFAGLLVILIALGGYLYFVESKRPAGDEGPKRDKVFTVEADKIEEITVKSESGERTTLHKSGSDWQIVQPVTGKPDSAEVSGITSNLASLEVQRVIDENPGDVAEYGLAQPRIEVTFKAGGKEHRLFIGRKTPPGTDLYAKIDDQKRVFLIPSFVDTSFNKTTFDFRDKTVLAVNRDNIDALSIDSAGKSTRFAKANGEWRLSQPIAARADTSAVEGLVSRLSTLQMKSIVAQDVSKTAEYGLDKPAATVTIGTGSSQASLVVGKSSGEGAMYARDLSRPLVFTIESTLLDDLKKDPAEYRQKDLFDARAFNATKIEVLRNGQIVAFEKQKTKGKDGKEEEKWRQVAPAAKDVDQGKVDNLISAVTLVRASSFVDNTAKTGLDKPELAVTVTSDQGKRQEKVTFGRSGSDAYASRGGEPGAAKIEASALDNITKALEELK